MISLIMFSLIYFGLQSAPAHAHNCLVKEQELHSSQPLGRASCQITQEPVLEEGLFTFPYLGTRSYRVRYWKAEAVQVQAYQETYVTRIFDRCRGWLVDKDFATSVTSSSRAFVLEGPNVDERIDDESKLAPPSREQIEVLWKALLQRCGYQG